VILVIVLLIPSIFLSALFTDNSNINASLSECPGLKKTTFLYVSFFRLFNKVREDKRDKAN
jgi:hypothetical protein